ncbi:MAG: hypothetical protein H6727_18730 [Myxococcales bacterium]|nr:hypothetical protein [Myxococcales bacterium]
MLSLLKKYWVCGSARRYQRLVEMVEIYSPPGDEADILAYLERLLRPMVCPSSAKA